MNHPAEFPPGHNPKDQGPARCDFCTVRTLRLAGAMDFPLDRELHLGLIELQPIHAGPFGIVGLGLSIQPAIIQAAPWGACVVCAPVVTRRDPDRLAAHVLGEWVAAGKTPDPSELPRLQSLYAILLPALGPPTPSLR